MFEPVLAYSCAMRAALFCILAGCSFSSAVGGDGGPETPTDACVTFSAQTDTCLLQAGPELALTGDLEFSTATGVLTDRTTGMPVAVTQQTVTTLGDPVVAIVASSIALAANTRLRAVGTRGFALIAIGTLTLGTNAIIDVSDSGAGARGPCAGGPTQGEGAGGGGAGGGGGGFGGAGGRGGDGNSDNIISGTTGGNPANPSAAPAGPRGGCPGAQGGNGDEPGGLGGHGGGAVWLTAGKLIDIASGAGINAGGGGGRGGTRTTTDGDAGGGGGGSGGVIWLEAPIVRSAGTLAANGGSGGEGSGGSQPGAVGIAGRLDVGRALGGDGSCDVGSAGGAGGHRDDANGLIGATPLPGGGGGGGGGVGFIRVVSGDKTLAAVSPAAP